MKIVIGLGNPGPEYVISRHNAGVVCVDLLATKLIADYGWRRQKQALMFKTDYWVLLKSAGVFMNESGRMLQDLKYINYSVDNLYIAHDDLDLRLGEYKIQLGVGPKVHYGLQSMEATIGTKNFWRIRIGIDNRDSDNRTPGESYVLEGFKVEEKKVLDGVLEKICDEILKAAH